MEKWSHTITRVVISKTWFTNHNRNRNRAGVQHWRVYRELDTPRNGTLTMWLSTQWMWKKNSRNCLSLSTMAVWKVLRLVQVSAAYRYSWGENIELNGNVWDIQAYYIAQAAVVRQSPSVRTSLCGESWRNNMLDRVRTKLQLS